MPKFKNVSPLGALDIPALGRVVQPGEVFEVPADIARSFSGQTEVFREVVQAKRTSTKDKEPKPPAVPAEQKGGDEQ